MLISEACSKLQLPETHTINYHVKILLSAHLASGYSQSLKIGVSMDLRRLLCEYNTFTCCCELINTPNLFFSLVFNNILL